MRGYLYAMFLVIVLSAPLFVQKKQKQLPANMWREMKLVLESLDVYESKKIKLEAVLNQSIQAILAERNFDEKELRQALTEFNTYRIELKSKTENIIKSLKLNDLPPNERESCLVWELVVKKRFEQISKIRVSLSRIESPKNMVHSNKTDWVIRPVFFYFWPTFARINL